MDIRCPVCGEPWEIDSLHSMGDWIGEDLTFPKARARFMEQGCEAFGTTHGEGIADPAVVAIMDLLGDDVDGAASLLEDFGL